MGGLGGLRGGPQKVDRGAWEGWADCEVACRRRAAGHGRAKRLSWWATVHRRAGAVNFI